MIEEISPLKLIQHNNNYAPWLNREYFNLLAQKDLIHKKAINSNNDQNLWREFQSFHNNPNKTNINIKKKYYQNRLNKPYSTTESNPNQNNNPTNYLGPNSNPKILDSAHNTSNNCDRKMWFTIKKFM